MPMASSMGQPCPDLLPIFAINSDRNNFNVQICKCLGNPYFFLQINRNVPHAPLAESICSAKKKR